MTDRTPAASLLADLDAYGARLVAPVAAVFACIGAGMVVHAAPYVQRLGGEGMLGWGVGLATLRDIAPLVVALIVTRAAIRRAHGAPAAASSGRRSSVVALILASVCLTLLADAVTLASAAVASKVLLGASPAQFFRSITDNMHSGVLLAGLAKSAAFGLVVALGARRAPARDRATTEERAQDALGARRAVALAAGGGVLAFHSLSTLLLA